MADSEKLPVQKHRNAETVKSPEKEGVPGVEKKSKKPKKKEKKPKERERAHKDSHICVNPLLAGQMNEILVERS